MEKQIEKMFAEVRLPPPGCTTWRRFELRHAKTFARLFRHSVGMWIGVRFDLWKLFKARKLARDDRRRQQTKQRHRRARSRNAKNAGV